MRSALKKRPFVVTKLRQLLQVVRESHEQPMTGSPRRVELVHPGELGITFIGHSSFFLQVGGRNLLIDPVFTKRLVLLRRQRRPGLLINELPPIDLILLSHAHMDHLSRASLRRVIRATRRQTGNSPAVVVPRGVEDLVARLGFSQVFGLSWWEHIELLGLRVTMTPCQHWGARLFRDTYRGYGGYVVEYQGRQVYHCGDSAYFSGFREIGRRLAPEISLLPIGAYEPPSFRDVHMGPEQAVQAFHELKSKMFVPMHFGTYRLSYEPMHEPAQRLMLAGNKAGCLQNIRFLVEGMPQVF